MVNMLWEKVAEEKEASKNKVFFLKNKQENEKND